MGYGIDLLKAALRRTLARLGYFIGRYPNVTTLDAHLVYLLDRLGINCVLDVGAHHGDYGRELRRLGYAGRIDSFEPIPENFAALRKQCAGDPHWRAHRCALGAAEATAEIKVMTGTTFGSFLPPSDYGLSQFAAKMQVERLEPVQVRRLDSVFDECVAGLAEPRVLLKIDTQGFALKVLAGAGDRLARVTALQTEVSCKPIYQGMANSFAETIAFLQQQGFELTGLFPVTWDRSDNLRVIEFDCIMCRPLVGRPPGGDGPAHRSAGPHFQPATGLVAREVET